MQCNTCGKLSVAYYLRISSDPEGERAGVNRQREDCLREGGRRGWCVCPSAIYEDNDVSAYRGKPRPAYSRMLKAVEAKWVTAIVAWAPDRLTRHLKELETLIDTVERAGCQLVTIQAGEWDLATPEGRFMARQLGLLARLEAEKIAARVKRARQQEAEAGLPAFGGKRAWGFEPDNRTLVPAEVEQIQMAAAELLAGKSLTSVARLVGRQPTSVRKALLAPRMIGKRLYQGQLIPAVWAPILDEDTYAGVKAVLEARKREKWGTQPRKYLLTPWMQCGVCGGRMAGNGAGPTTPPGYRCVMGCTRRQAPLLDDMVRDFVLARADLTLPTPGIDPKLVTAVRALEARIEELDREYLEGDGGLSAAVYARARGGLEAKLSLAQDDLDAAAAEPVWVDARGEGWTWWEQADLRQRRELIERFVARVIVRPTKKGRVWVEDDIEIVPRPDVGSFSQG